MKEKRSAVLSYMPQLDSLRSFAMFGVMITHFLRPDDPIRFQIPWGWLGVRLFFVLSGFLVTGVLIASRQKIDQEQASPWKIMQNFFIRRCFRLFPLYYLYLALAFIIHPDIRGNILAFILYAQNILFAVQPETFGTLAHLWTLAIEAQFYLFLPWLVIFLPKKTLIPLFVAMILFAPLFRVALYGYGLTFHQANMLVPTHFDTLCLGGLLSALMAAGQSGQALARKLCSIGLWLGAPMLMILIFGRIFWGNPAIFSILDETGAGLFFTWLIGRTAIGFDGLTGAILNQNWLVYGGKISYAVYLFHYEIPPFFHNQLMQGTNIMAVHNTRIIFPVYVALSIVIAIVAWKWIEEPMNQQKKRFVLK